MITSKTISAVTIRSHAGCSRAVGGGAYSRRGAGGHSPAAGFTSAALAMLPMLPPWWMQYIQCLQCMLDLITE